MPPRQGVECAKPRVKYVVHGGILLDGEAIALNAECPFCKTTTLINKRSLIENGRKKCNCGASFFPDGTAESRR